MGTLILLRHGQANFLKGDHDTLSELGEVQSQMLGEHFVDRGFKFDHIFVGPRKRHKQTHVQVATQYSSNNINLPDPIHIEELDEYPAIHLVKKYLISDWSEEQRKQRTKEEFNLEFRTLMKKWVRGEIDDVDIESWPNFRTRISTAVDKMTSIAKEGNVIAAFTSAGSIAAAAGLSLGVDDEKMMEMSWMIRNTTYSDFLFKDGEVSLRTFNASPHIHNEEHLTYY
jgi:broad specificity phosphatase PhoE